MTAESRASTAAPCELLDWDSRHFGFPIARVAGYALDAERARAIDEWCGDRGVRCAYLLADAEDDETARIAEQHNYRRVDERVTVRRSMEGVEKLALGGPEEMEIREATERELDSLRDLASRSHEGSRFYVDPGFPRERSDALYAAWVERGLRHPDHGLLVAMLGAEPAGYMVYSRRIFDGEGRGELGAVDERHRGQGIGRALHVAMLRRLRRRGAVTHRGILSGSNGPILRLHDRLGFWRDATEVWHHKWFGGAREDAR